jgi:hypothetical protein
MQAQALFGTQIWYSSGHFLRARPVVSKQLLNCRANSHHARLVAHEVHLWWLQADQVSPLVCSSRL